jgi:hypothetical protein
VSSKPGAGHIATAALLLALTAPAAHAGDNSCLGTVQQADKGSPLLAIDDCFFDPKSTVGKKILAICPIGSQCNVSLDLRASRKASKLKDIDWIEGPHKFVRLHGSP